MNEHGKQNKQNFGPRHSHGDDHGGHCPPPQPAPRHIREVIHEYEAKGWVNIGCALPLQKHFYLISRDQETIVRLTVKRWGQTVIETTIYQHIAGS